MFGERDTFGVNGTFCVPEINFCINVTKSKTIFCLSLHYNDDDSYLFVNRKEICKLKVKNGNVNLLTQFGLGCISYKCIWCS